MVLVLVVWCCSRGRCMLFLLRSYGELLMFTIRLMLVVCVIVNGLLFCYMFL